MATVQEPKRATIQQWRESAAGIERVDRANKLIRGVRVIGLESQNERSYDLDVLKQAIPLYEGAKVYIDHQERVKPGEPRKDRSMRDRWGTLKNVRADERGLIGDIAYFESDPMTGKILEMAEESADSFGMSHDAGGVAQRGSDGHVDVREITNVKSVDVVCDPATTMGLFESIQESEETMTKTAKRMKLRESLKTNKSPLLEPINKYLSKPENKRLREEVGDQDMEVDEEEDEAGEQAKMTFQKAVETVLRDNEMSELDKLGAIREMIGAKAMEEAGDEGKMKEMSDEDKAKMAEAEAEKEKMTQESRKIKEELDSLRESFDKSQKELATEKLKGKCRELFESAGVDATDVRMSALMRAESDGERKELLESWPKASSGKGRPGSSPGVSFTESLDDKLPEDSESLWKALR